MSGPGPPRFALGWYNGWSPDARRATLPVQRDAIRTGRLARPSACSVCGTGKDVWLHDERYDRPLEAYAVCRACHRALHRRFDDPAPWRALVQAHGGGGAWFEQLSLDPASQRQPFDVTYPAGLPRSGEPASKRVAAPPSAAQRDRFGLSKSRIPLYEQCPKRLWLAVHRPELAEVMPATTSSMAVGHQVGALACALLADGYMVEGTRGLAAAAAETAALLADGWNRPLFEATFIHDGVAVRVDLMIPGEAGWHVAEVKSTTGVRSYHLSDIATQLWVMRARGVPVASTAIRHLDRAFVLERERDYHGLFADSAIAALVEPVIASRPRIVTEARATLAGPEPAREVGAHCDDPFACPFKPHCARDLPPAPDWPVQLLPDAAGKAIARSWAAQGIADLRHVPADAMPSAKLRRVHAATTSGIAYHDAAAIRAETGGWATPRTFLDFETIQFAIPRWTGTRPFEQVPFQFSAHIAYADGAVQHRWFLSVDGQDPRRACAEALALLPATGSVIAWNASFERGCLLGLAGRFPELAAALGSLADRLVDLLPVVRRHYYHRDMRGSWSLKSVLPTIAPALAYEQLAGVSSGSDAQAAYLEAINPTISAERRAALHTELLSYCERDTFAMKIVLEQLTDAA